ncbi:hypothetical protein M404DRAFT_726417 [Pisolithus tinctorius Marx 270]|uniref:Uncharacterized protein n=1 Tax=Pisolithus tinctorius Marx 270 TaxID=870435 RepID=A0A0C3NKN4_PISTI|nr:hypothetical protein M404DRAFT_726417 [Pisolithus tinctorius Marx 270]
MNVGRGGQSKLLDDPSRRMVNIPAPASCFVWGPLSLLLKGSWPAKLSIPSFVSAIHIDAVVVESRIVSLHLAGKRGSTATVRGHIKSITQLARHRCWGGKCDRVCPFRMECVIYMRAKNARRQVLNISHTKTLAVEVPNLSSRKSIKAPNTMCLGRTRRD